MMGDGSMNLPPGFQFCPTDEELITHFLYRKASRLPCHPNIPHLHFYRSDPSHLQGKAVVSGNRYYFFTQVGSKEINGGKTENGYWKAVDEEEEEEEEGEAIFSRGNKLLIGTKKHLVFFLGQPPSAIQTNWFMEQYHLPTSNITSSERKKWVLCRVHDGGEGNSQGFSHSSSGDNDEDGIELSCLDEMFFSLHDDLEDFLHSSPMAFCVKSSRNILKNLKPKLRLFSTINQTSRLEHRRPLTPPFSPQFKNLFSNLHDRTAQLSFCRFRSSEVEKQLDSSYHVNSKQALDFPGGKVVFTPDMSFIPESPEERAHCYRVLDENGQPVKHSNFVPVSKEIAVKMYSDMVTLQTMDTIFYEAQRQGRISFYATTIGEEAINIASAAALTADDVIFPQYREPGVLLWRGFTLQEFANQCFSNKTDYGKGRQMPIHYGSNKHNYFTVASTIATQLPHAVGAAYSLKMDRKNACTVTYFGDGGTSEGDFHAALNFAAVMEAPVIFVCRNNGWAISTPTSDQFRSDGAVVRGRAYGVRSIRVDGNDALAMYSVVHTAREMAVCENRPILIEALTYRVGHHSTSDDSTKYRPVNEIEWWKTEQDPVSRFRKWIESKDWWNSEAESELRSSVKKQLLHAIQTAENIEKPPVQDLFTDVYDVLPSNLQEQERLLRETIKRHPQDYPQDVPL